MINERFVAEDARAIIEIPIPQREVQDRLVWAGSNTGIYSAKDGYRFCQGETTGTSSIRQCEGWGKIWRLPVPHKLKIFVWRFCRNTVPVRRRLSAKGVSLPITCPMCNVDIEHLLHVFFDCRFAADCWHYVGLVYDMRAVEYAPDWLLDKLSEGSTEEIVKLCTVLWGIWFWRNKKVWDGKEVTAAIAMDNSIKSVADWREARTKNDGLNQSNRQKKQASACKWKPPEQGTLKVNVDASFFPGAATFSIGMVLRDHQGTIMAGKTLCLASPASVFEAEAIGAREALSWLKEQQLHNHTVMVETDSLLVAQGIEKRVMNLLEVGEVLDQCQMLLSELVATSIHFVRNQANRVAHEVARIPCLVNCQIVFTSPPMCLAETILRESSF